MENLDSPLKRVWEEHGDHRALESLYAAIELENTRLTAILCPGYYYYYIFNFANYKFDYFSPELEQFLGFRLETTTLNAFLNHVHPEDRKFMQRCEKKAGDFLFKKILSSQITDYKVGYYYRIKDKEGKYHLIYQQTITLSMDAQDRISKVLGVHMVVDHLMEKNKISFIGLNENPSYLAQDVLTEKETITPIDQPLSKREKTIIELLAEGNNTKEIAGILEIKPATVSVHRRNALRKAKCNNVAHLVAKSIRSGWI